MGERSSTRTRLGAVFSHRDLAHALGLPVEQVELWCAAGELPAMPVSGGWLVSRRALLRAVEAGDRAPTRRLLQRMEARHAQP